MVNQEGSSTTIPLNSGNHSESQQAVSENGEKTNSLFSPRFKSVVAMAGWDEEALLCASLIVEDTPVRNSKQRKRVDLSNLKSPLSTSRRKRRAQRRSIGASMPVAVLSLDEDPPAKEGPETEKSAAEAALTTKIVEDEVKEIGGIDCKSQGSSVSSSSAVIPCIDRLREELSCAICLDICYEPSTTPCGHSFCKRCLKSAAYKCGRRCPKCRQLISNGRSCTINTVLWNTIQLLFPQEVEARKASDDSNGKEEAQGRNPARINQDSLQNESVVAVLEPVSRGTIRRSSRQNIRRRPSDTISQQDDVVRRSNNPPPIQDEDAALALRLQREEFMGVFDHQRSDDAPPQQRSSSLALARANLRAMASRATSIRFRGRTT